MKHNVITALLVVGSLCSIAVAQQGLVPGGETPDLALVFTGDVIGYIEPCG